MKNIIIFGASGHSKPIVDILEKIEEWNIVGYIDSFKKENNFFGYPVLGSKKNLLNILEKYNIFGGIVAIGDNFIRSKVVENIQIIIPNFIFISAIHPKAVLGRDVKVGVGTTIMAGVVINSDSQIGKHSIINTSSTIEHDSIIGNFSTIAPAVTMGGDVKVGDFATVSIGSIVKHLIKIGDDVVIGANSLVLKDIENSVVAYGSPAKFVRCRKRSDKYL